MTVLSGVIMIVEYLIYFQHTICKAQFTPYNRLCNTPKIKSNVTVRFLVHDYLTFRCGVLMLLGQFTCLGIMADSHNVVHGVHPWGTSNPPKTK